MCVEQDVRVVSDILSIKFQDLFNGRDAPSVCGCSF